MNVEIQILTHEDTDCFSELIKVFEWQNFFWLTNTHFQILIKCKSFLIFVAKTNHNLLGRFIVPVLDNCDSEKPPAYIYDISESPNYQSKVLGNLLISKLNDSSDNIGFKKAFVHTERGYHQAVNFYNTTPNTFELQSTHLTYTFGELKDNEV